MAAVTGRIRNAGFQWEIGVIHKFQLIFRSFPFYKLMFIICILYLVVNVAYCDSAEKNYP